MQQNYKTKVAYKGRNEVILNVIQQERKFKKGLWITFLQAKEMGCQVRKGEKGVKIMRFVNEKEIGVEDKVAFRFYTVFNIDQIEKV